MKQMKINVDKISVNSKEEIKKNQFINKWLS